MQQAEVACVERYQHASFPMFYTILKGRTMMQMYEALAISELASLLLVQIEVQLLKYLDVFHQDVISLIESFDGKGLQDAC
jgi:hypothetical protein